MAHSLRVTTVALSFVLFLSCAGAQSPAAATTFTVQASSAVIGKIPITISASDENYNEPVAVTCNPSCTPDNSTVTFKQGKASATLSVYDEGVIAVRVKGQAAGTITVGSASLAFVNLPANIKAGTPVSFGVEERDGNGRTVPGYAGTVKFTCANDDHCPSNPTAVQPGNTDQFSATFQELPETIIVADQDFANLKSPATEIAPQSSSFNGGEIFRLQVGGTDNFSPSAAAAGKLYVDFFFENGATVFGADNPSTGTTSDILGSRLRFWLGAGLQGNPSGASKVVSAASSLGTTSTPSALGTAGTAAVSMIESARLRGGVAIRLGGSGRALFGIPRAEPGRTALELLLAVGGQTPTSSAGTTPQVFCANGAAVAGASSPSSNGCDASKTPVFSVVYPATLDHFYKSWETGLRLVTYYQADPGASPVLPSSLELTLGENSAVTQGHEVCCVAHFEAFLPLPNDQDWINVIFSGDFQFGRRLNPFLPLPNNLTLVNPQPTGPYVLPNYQVGMAPPTQSDALRIGVAVDLVDLIEHHLSLKMKSATGGNGASGQR